MTGFLGSYLHQLDDKGRVALPASFRRNASDDGFVLIAAEGPSLFLYPERVWREKEGELIELRRRQPEARKTLLSITANAHELAPDKQGRILIPERLQQVAELDGEALIVGALDKVEIWNPDRFEDTTREAREDIAPFVRQILV